LRMTLAGAPATIAGTLGDDHTRGGIAITSP